ncbi:MAG: DUF2130 domain-containing protein [Pseudomonadota bacterium]
MAINKQEIQCPSCGELISIDDVLTRPIEEQIKKKYEITQKANEQALANKLDAVNRQVAEVEEKNKNINSIIVERLNDQLKIEKNKLFKEVRAEAEQEQSSKTAFLEEQLKNKDEKLVQAKKNEIELRKEKIRLEEEKQNFELEKIHQLEEMKKGLMEEARKKAAEEQHYVNAQLQKQVSDATKTIKDLTRQLEQGSQKTQGEVLELELEDLLKAEFPHDEVLAVPPGVAGADIIQKVFDRAGRLCGQIAWETKKTKSWNENWIQKLKDDQRAIKADLAVIVSAALPENVKGFIFRDGVWICNIKVIVALATALRMNLESITREKALSVGKNEKLEILYGYLTGVEFKQRVEAMLEVFSSLDADLKKERIAYEKIWAKREKQIKKVMINMAGMHGDLSGFVPLPQIKSLELSIEEKE